MMGLSIEQIEILLLVAAVVAMLARRLRLPYTVGLVAAGIGLAFSSFAGDLRLTRELIFNAFLPPLVFEAAISIPWGEFRRDLPVLLVLATAGVLLAAGLTAAGMHYLAGWEWTAAVLFGVLIAATDPVSVIATFKEAGVHGRLRLLVEAESLLNDGTAAVLFSVALAAVQGGAISGAGVGRGLAASSLGGLLCGAGVAGGVLALAGRTEDHLVEITFTTVAAYGSFLLAEQFHVSGVLATLTAGILIGNVGSLGAISDKGREAVGAFWEYVAFAVNSLVFLLIGIRLAHHSFVHELGALGVAIALVTLGRALAVYGCCAPFARATLRVSLPHQHLLFWGGLRGALALALALSLPAATPDRAAIVTVSFAVVAFSLIVQGLTITPLLRRLGEMRSDGAPPSPGSSHGPPHAPGEEQSAGTAPHSHTPPAG
jgi:monovalent cation:H+ antiporter, CPA1 family